VRDNRIQQKRNQLLLFGRHRGHLDQTLPRRPHAPSKTRDSHRGSRQSTEPRCDVEGAQDAELLRRAREIAPELRWATSRSTAARPGFNLAIWASVKDESLTDAASLLLPHEIAGMIVKRLQA